MPWFNVGSGSRRVKPKRMQRFEQADRVVVEVFADLHKARHLESKLPPTHHQVRCNGSSARLGID